MSDITVKIGWKVGDKVEWEQTKYGRRKITITLHTGTIEAIYGGMALINKGKWQRTVEVYLTRLRRYADTTMPEHQP